MRKRNRSHGVFSSRLLWHEAGTYLSARSRLAAFSIPKNNRPSKGAAVHCSAEKTVYIDNRFGSTGPVIIGSENLRERKNLKPFFQMICPIFWMKLKIKYKRAVISSM